MSRCSPRLCLLAVSLVLSGCQPSASDICPALLSRMSDRLAEQGIVPESDAFRAQYASARQACHDEPAAFRRLVTWSGH